MILKSRKFWLMISDVVISIVVYFVSKYVVPSAAEDILWLIGILQPVFVTLINAIAKEDAALKSNPSYKA